jgi:hypothetical protein
LSPLGRTGFRVSHHCCSNLSPPLTRRRC